MAKARCQSHQPYGGHQFGALTVIPSAPALSGYQVKENNCSSILHLGAARDLRARGQQHPLSLYAFLVGSQPVVTQAAALCHHRLLCADRYAQSTVCNRAMGGSGRRYRYWRRARRINQYGVCSPPVQATTAAGPFSGDGHRMRPDRYHPSQFGNSGRTAQNGHGGLYP